jgi:hypothetical protein
MQIEYLDRLAPDVRNLVEEVQRAIGMEIVVTVDQGRAQNRADRPDTMACEVELNRATILIPTVEYFPDGAVLHELLHIRRHLVDGVPMLVDCVDYLTCDPEIGTKLAKHDNDLEHLVIVPMELDQRPERREHWERAMRRNWDELASGAHQDTHRRERALRYWAFMQFVLPDSPTRPVAQDVLNRLGLTDEAVNLCNALALVLADKEQAVRVWFEHLGVPLDIASLDYINQQGEVPLVR